MNPYEPPKAQIDVGTAKVGRVAKCCISLVAGMMSYYVYYRLSGFLGELKWPPLLESIAQLYKPITIPAVDLLILGTPMVLSYAVVAYAWSKIVHSSARSVLASFALGWLVPALVVISYGENKEPGVFLDMWSRAPHVAVLDLASLIGVWLGFRLSLMQSRGFARAA
jgi:hypothetical protein